MEEAMSLIVIAAGAAAATDTTPDNSARQQPPKITNIDSSMSDGAFVTGDCEVARERLAPQSAAPAFTAPSVLPFLEKKQTC